MSERKCANLKCARLISAKATRCRQCAKKHTDKQAKQVIRLEIHQADGLKGGGVCGFAGWLSDGKLRDTKRGTILLNVEAVIGTVAMGDVPASEVPYFAAENIMHEVIHALEEWFGVAFSEERVNALIQAYADSRENEDEEQTK